MIVPSQTVSDHITVHKLRFSDVIFTKSHTVARWPNLDSNPGSSDPKVKALSSGTANKN